MTKETRANRAQATNPTSTLVIKQTVDETKDQATARVLLEPAVRHGLTSSAFAAKALGNSTDLPGITDYAGFVAAAGEKAENGDLAIASRMLAAQAITLDSMFTEFARRAALNMGQYVDATDRFGRLAMKAQSNCRSTLEALAKLHQPREQTVRHVHVNEGGQAIVADQFHHHSGASENVDSVRQSHAAGATGQCPSLPCPDPVGDGVPIASGKRETAMQDARRHESGSA
jgi:hypothetical protein